MWNGVFSRKLRYWPFAAFRIDRHFLLRGLWKVKPEIGFAIVRYIMFLNCFGEYLASSSIGRVGMGKAGMTLRGGVILQTTSDYEMDTIS